MTVAVGQTGYMLAGQELPIQSANIVNNVLQTATSYKPVGVQLYVTPQSVGLGLRKVGAEPGRVQPSLEQRFICVDVAHPGHDALIQQNRLQTAFRRGQLQTDREGQEKLPSAFA